MHEIQEKLLDCRNNFASVTVLKTVFILFYLICFKEYTQYPKINH